MPKAGAGCSSGKKPGSGLCNKKFLKEVSKYSGSCSCCDRLAGEQCWPVNPSLDPFATFNQEEKRRKYAQLSVFEKVMVKFS